MLLFMLVGLLFSGIYVFGLWDEERQNRKAREKNEADRKDLILRIGRGELK